MGAASVAGCSGCRVPRGAVTDSRIVQLCGALSHPARLEILRRLARGSCVCSEIVENAKRPQSTVSHHLKVLREAGLVEAEPRGNCVCYRLNAGVISELRGLLEGLC